MKLSYLKLFSFCLIFLLGSLAGRSQLLVEDFDYPNGDLLTAHGWTAHNGGGTQPIDVTNGLTFTGYAGSGIGGGANLDNNGEDDNKLFTTAQTTGVVYAAFIIQTQATNSAGYFIHFGQTVISTTFFTRVWVNATGNGVGVGASAPATYIPITVATPTLLVIKLDIATKVSSLFVFNTFPASEPGTANATFTETAAFTNVGCIALRQYNASEKVVVDGIRVATTWADAVSSGGSSSPVIAASPGSLSGFSYIYNNGPSASQSYNLSGTNLTPASGNLTVTPSTNYEISLNNTTFSQTPLTVSYTAGTLASTPVYVRLKAGLAGGQYNAELIANSGGGAPTINVSCSGVVEQPAVTTVPYTEDFSTGLGQCYQRSVSGPSKYWLHSAAGEYAYMNGFNTGVLEEDWLILPGINFNNYSNVALLFDSYMQYGYDDADNYLKLVYSTNYAGVGDPTAATWTELQFAHPTEVTTWTTSRLIDLSAITGANVYIAFKYHYNVGVYRLWQVDNLSIFEVTEPLLSVSPLTLSGFTYVEGFGPSEAQTYTISALNLNGTGNITITAPANYEISRYGSTFVNISTLPFADGIIIGQPVTMYVRLKTGLAIGTYNDENVLNSGGGAVAVNVVCSGSVTPPLPIITSETVPQYIEGVTPTNNDRIPFAYRASIANLLPNTTYRYINQIVISTDTETTPGAGNVIFVNQSGDFYRTSSSSFETAGNYGEFTTDADGNYTGWFMNEPSGNARFTPGNQVFMRIRLNDGADGITAVNYLTTTASATVLTFGTEAAAEQGTAIRAESDASSKNIVFLYDNTTGTGRPLYGTSIETVGIDYTTLTSISEFYRLLVSGVDGSWGGIVPNINANGVRLVEERSLADGSIVNTDTSADGLWGTTNTVNPTGGTTNVLVLILNPTSDPVISVSPTTLSNFTYVVGYGPSDEQSFSIGGQNLTTNISIAGSANYEISTGTGDSFVATDPIELTQTGGVVAPTTIYVRLKAGLVPGDYSGEELTATAAGAENKTVTLNGSVVPEGVGGLLLVENFEYTIGTNLTDNGWVAHSGEGNESPTVTDGLSFAGYAGTDVGGAALLDNTGEDVHHTFGEQNTGAVYAAFIVNPTANASAGYFIHFGQTTIGTTYFTRIWLNETADGLGIGQSAPATYVPITVGQPTLGVMKFDFASMTSSLFVFNSFPDAEPALADADFVETGGFTNVGSIALRQFNAAEHIIVDGIRVATSWEDAVAASGGAPVVASPSFNPPAGNYFDPIDVTISTVTAGATLYYSETSAAGPWTLYTAPLNLAVGTTLWAYGEKDGYDNSPVSSATYTFTGATQVATIAELRLGATDGTIYELTGEAILTFQSSTRNQKFIQDATAAIMIDDSPGVITTVYGLYDGITGITGTLTLYNNMLEFVPTMDPGAATSTGNTVTPVEVSLNDLDESYQAQLVKVTFVDFVLDGMFVVSTNYEITDPAGAGVFRTQYGDVDYIGTIIPANLQDITGVMLQYQTTMQLVARSLADFSNSATTDPLITATPSTLNDFTYIEGFGPSVSQTYALTGSNLVGSGSIAITAPVDYEISGNDVNYTGSLSIPFADGVITGQPVTIYVRLKADLAPGLYEAETITHTGGDAPEVLVTLNGEVTVQSAATISGQTLPQYIEGLNGTNNDRIPFAFSATLTGLDPNKTYRYINQVVLSSDAPETNGAGNVIFASQAGDFIRTTSPAFDTDGNYGVLTTDVSGSFTGWFVTEPTGNARFTPGNHVFMRIRLNDGNDGITAAHLLTTTDSTKVLTFGVEAIDNQGTALRAISGDSPKDFVFLYDNLSGTGRPLYGTFIETSGIDFSAITQYATFFKDFVAGVNGSWGAIIPNVNANGVQLVQVLDLANGTVEKSYTGADGIWGTTETVNPSGGTAEVLVIDLIEIGINTNDQIACRVWASNNELIVESNTDSQLNIQIINLLGQPVFNQEIGGIGIHRLFHHLNTGVYIISLKTINGTTNSKIIIR